MSSRGPRATEFEERDYYPPPRRPAVELDDMDFRRARNEVDVRIRERERESDRTPTFLREDARRTEAGPMVLRKRDVEIVDRRARSPSPVRVREERIIRRPKSVSPPHFHGHGHEHEHEHERSRTRVVERERERVRSPSVVRRRSPSPRVVRYVERRERSPSPVEHEHEHIRTRIVERERERAPSPSPSPPPPPQVVRGPTIERQVITHYTDIDHGMIKARPPSPPPAPRTRTRERETDIDISLSKNRTEVDIHRSVTRNRSRSRERRSHFHDDELVIRETDRLRIDDSKGRRRAHSAAPIASPRDEEAEYITSKIDSRGRMGEAWGGATKDWTIVDVPPGTERVRMDGVGGASTDTTWSKYSGVRRTQFIPERDGAVAPRAPSPAPAPSRDRTSVSIYDREKEIDIEKITDRRITRTTAPPPPPPPKEMWTEITKDLCSREAIEQLGYEYEETKWFFYIMSYLAYDDVLRLTELTENIRRARKDRVREIEYERDYDWDRYRHRHAQPQPRHNHNHHYHHHDRRSSGGWDDEYVTEREFVYDSRNPGRVYYR